MLEFITKPAPVKVAASVDLINNYLAANNLDFVLSDNGANGMLKGNEHTVTLEEEERDELNDRVNEWASSIRKSYMDSILKRKV